MAPDGDNDGTPFSRVEEGGEISDEQDQPENGANQDVETPEGNPGCEKVLSEAEQLSGLHGGEHFGQAPVVFEPSQMAGGQMETGSDAATGHLGHDDPAARASHRETSTTENMFSMIARHTSGGGMNTSESFSRPPNVSDARMQESLLSPSHQAEELGKASQSSGPSRGGGSDSITNQSGSGAGSKLSGESPVLEKTAGLPSGDLIPQFSDAHRDGHRANPVFDSIESALFAKATGIRADGAWQSKGSTTNSDGVVGQSKMGNRQLETPSMAAFQRSQVSGAVAGWSGPLNEGSSTDFAAKSMIAHMTEPRLNDAQTSTMESIPPRGGAARVDHLIQQGTMAAGGAEQAGSAAPLLAAEEKSVPSSLPTDEQFDSLEFSDRGLRGDIQQSTDARNTPTHANRAEVYRGVVAQMQGALARSGAGPIEIALNPEELGNVRIALNVSEASIGVSILAERPETLDLQRRNIEQLV